MLISHASPSFQAPVSITNLPLPPPVTGFIFPIYHSTLCPERLTSPSCINGSLVL